MFHFSLFKTLDLSSESMRHLCCATGTHIFAPLLDIKTQNISSAMPALASSPKAQNSIRKFWQKGQGRKEGAETPCNGQITNTPEKSCCKSKMNSRKVSCKNAHDAGTYPRPKTNFWCGGTKQLLLTGTTGLHLSCTFLYHALRASASHLWAFNWMDQSQSLASAMV